jgi:hypothetical protein
MMIAASVTKTGRRLLVLGLQQENMKRLVNDQPIYKDLADEGVPGLEEWDVTILGPEDTARFIALVGREEK